MKYKVFELNYNDLSFKIEEDLPDIGAYLFVYKKGKCIVDTLQDSVELCKEVAFEDYDLPIELWKNASVKLID